jgi:hypothetical protein
MYAFDTQKHRAPHIHIQYADEHVVIGIPDGDILDGGLRANKLRLVRAWIEIHQEELMADWQLAIEGQRVFAIDPLR